MIPAELRSRIQCLNSDYLVFLPEEHDGSKLPLVIFLHGAGGAGDDIMQSKVKGKPTEIWAGIHGFHKDPAIVVAPQCLKQDKNGIHGVWTPEDLNVFLEHLKATLAVDDRRIYLAGISRGATVRGRGPRMIRNTSLPSCRSWVASAEKGRRP